jgi:hypothetical protein
LENDPQILRDVGAAGVFAIELDLLGQTIAQVEFLNVTGALQQRLFVAEQHGRHVRYPRLVAQDVPLLVLILLDIARDLRPWSNEAHFAYEHVPELRQFIELEAAQENAQRRDPAVSFGRERQPELVGVTDHRTELPDPEWLPELADANLPIEHRPAVGKLDRQRDEPPHRREQHQPDRGAHNVKETLHSEKQKAENGLTTDGHK